MENKDTQGTENVPGEEAAMEAVADQIIEEMEVLFAPPRFLDQDSGQELLVDTDALDPETFGPGEIVDVLQPGNKKTHYRVMKIDQDEDGGQGTAWVKEAPPIYGKMLLLFGILIIAWFALDKIFDLLF